MSKKSILRLITAVMAMIMLTTVCSIGVFAEQAPESESISLAAQEPEEDIGNIASFGDESVWSFLIQIFILILALLVGNILRRKIPFIRKSLIPTSLLGGLLILLIKLLPFYDNIVNQATMEIITYHALGIGFIALGLKQAKDSQKTSAGKVMETGILTAATYVIQGLVGLAVTMVLFYLIGFFPGGGIILALGFGQGTGQALNYGKMYETDFGFAGGTTWGLTIATVGFIAASVVGVTYMNILRKKGKLKLHSEEGVKHTLEDYVSEGEIPLTESVDKFTINFCMVFLVYAIAYLIMRVVNVNLIWGFNFLLGTILAALVRWIIKLLKKGKLMHRELTNNYLLDRISGFMFDLMIIAGVAAIDLSQLSGMWWQLLIVCALGTVATFIYLRVACNHLYPGYKEEAFFSMFGMLTGTASNGMILLREIDPKFETPAANNLVLQGIPAIAFGGVLLLLFNICNTIEHCWLVLALLVVAWVVYTAILFRKALFKKAYAKKAAKKAKK
jgi:ESS family glutamate:Na+ symporter